MFMDGFHWFMFFIFLSIEVRDLSLNFSFTMVLQTFHFNYFRFPNIKTMVKIFMPSQAIITQGFETLLISAEQGDHFGWMLMTSFVSPWIFTAI